jgi:hypothetical protein
MPNGSENVAVGNSALQNMGQANYNTAVGGIALIGLTTGSGNVAVGRGAGQKLTSGSNNLYLASPGVDKDSGVIRIGDGQTHTATYIAGIAGASNPNATKPVLVDPSTGQLVAGSPTPPPAAQGFGANNHPAIAGTGAPCTVGDVTLTAGTVGNGTPADGRLLNIVGNQVLFATFGTNFGGDGKTTFALPDLRAAAPNGTTYMICTQGVFPTH